MIIRQEILDAFQATSLILVFITVFFNIKYPLIVKNINIEIPEGKLAKKRAKKQILNNLLINNLPTMLLNGGSFYLFLPLTIKILKSSNFSLFHFDILPTAFIFIVLWIGLFFVWSFILFIITVLKILSIKNCSDLV